MNTVNGSGRDHQHHALTSVSVLSGKLRCSPGGFDSVAPLLTEVRLRVCGFSHFNPHIADREVRYSVIPNASGWRLKEWTTYVAINRQGLRDREHTFAKPTDTIRIAVLADSLAEALHLGLT